jgi:4-alpha-glucanotransferase
MSPEEIRRSGFGRDPAKFSTPTIAEGELTEFFGEHATKVAREILQLDRDALYRPRPEFAQSEARRKWCAAAFTDEKAAGVAEGLTRLEYEVLFLEDPDQPGRYHPRIALEQTAIFRSLEESEQAALRQLHDEFFYRQHTRFWEQEAMKKLPALVDATDMLICGEDLGMIPDAVPVVLKRLGLLSLEVQSMPKRLGQKIGNPRDYPYLSVCTTSTHDTPTLRGIWEEDTGARQEFHTQVLGREGAARSDCTPEIARVIIEQTLAGASMWCILPLQDWLALDANLRHPVAAAERINVPANPRNYWRYRMHLTIAQLRKAGDFGRLIRRLVVDSGRLPPC